MGTREIIDTIIGVVVIPLLGALTTFLINYLRVKSDELKCKISNINQQKYVQLAEDVITTAVTTIQQTFVDELKKGGGFTKERQAEAFEKCKTLVLDLLSENTIILLGYLYGDVTDWIEAKIEANVKYLKTGI
jgi:hypothetical protein